MGLLVLVVDVKSTCDFPLVSNFDTCDTSCIANPVFKKFLDLVILEVLLLNTDEQFWGLVYCWMCS